MTVIDTQQKELLKVCLMLISFKHWAAKRRKCLGAISTTFFAKDLACIIYQKLQNAQSSTKSGTEKLFVGSLASPFSDILTLCILILKRGNYSLGLELVFVRIC